MSFDPNKKVNLLFACLDWRLHPQIEEYFTKNNQGADLCVTAGSIKGLIDPQTQNYFLAQIEISKKLHNCQAIILTMHLDCGAYGGASAFENKDLEVANAKNELAKARAIVLQKFPELNIQTFIIGLEKTDCEWNIMPQVV